MPSRFSIDANIGRARSLPALFYKDAGLFAETAEKVFARTWQWVAEGSAVAEPLSQLPFTLLPGVLDEPLLFTRTEAGALHCLSNVCTHRAKLIVEKPAKGRVLRCGYHGRCFRLDGSFKSMPEFEGVENFPGPADHLAQIPFAEWLGLLFVSLDPLASLPEMTAPIRERLGWLPLDSLVFSEEDSKDYHVNAHWALYCDNYLEGFHIPFVHPALNQAIAFEQYSYELFPYGSLQLGLAKEGEPCFDIPPQAQDHGKRIYAYYYWLFPNLMLNFYPWGLSLNVVEPLGLNQTRVRFRTYYYPGNELDRARNQLDLTEMEDEAVVESVQEGVQSRYYERGRYSVRQETAVHHFHVLLDGLL